MSGGRGQRGLAVKLLVSAGVTAGLLFGLVHYTELDLNALARADVHPRYLVLAVCAYFGVNLLRALRFRLIHREISGLSMRFWLQVALVHSATNQVLPFRTGEVTYLYLMRRAGQATIGRSALVLLVSRILDLAAVFLFSLAVVPLVGDQLAVSPLLAAGVCAAILGAAVALLFLLRPALALVDRGLGRFVAVGKGGAFLARVHGRVTALVAEASMFRGARHFFGVFALSAGMWAGLYVTFYGMLNGFGFPISLPATVIGSVGAVLTNVLPVNGVANVGTLEAGWTLGLMMVGFDKDHALAAGIWEHAGVMALSLAMGLSAFVSMALEERRRR